MLKQLGICVSGILTLVAALWDSFFPTSWPFSANVLAHAQVGSARRYSERSQLELDPQGLLVNLSDSLNDRFRLCRRGFGVYSLSLFSRLD